MAGLVAAVDGGGTKTAAVLADRAGRVTVLPRQGGCNPQDNPGWEVALAAALAPLAGAEAVALGLPGYGESPAIDARIAAAVAARLGGRGQLFNDVELAARSAFPSGGGVLLLSGTGSMAYAFGPAGAARSGGWGDLFGDEGSAFWIGRAALAAASRERDGRDAEDGLARGLERRLGAADGGPFALLSWALAQPHPRSAVASVAEAVDALAAEGLGKARAILDGAAAELIRLAQAAARGAGLPTGFAWAPSGSVFRSRHLRDCVALQLGAPVAPTAGVLAGGLAIAARAAGWPADAPWCDRVAAGAAAA